MSLYLLAEAGALLTAGATAGAFAGRDASPQVMPTLPWMLRTYNTPPPMQTPPIMTRVAPGTPAPPSPYRGEAGMLDHAGAVDPSTLAGEWASWQASVAAAQQHGQPAPEPPPDVYAAMTPEQRQAASQQAQTTYWRGGSPGTATYPSPVPAPLRVMAISPPAPAAPPALPPPVASTPSAPPILFGRPAPTTPTPPSLDIAPAPTSSGGAGGGGSPAAMPWGAVAAGGAVLALLYLGRKKKRRR